MDKKGWSSGWPFLWVGVVMNSPLHAVRALLYVDFKWKRTPTC